MSVSEEPQFPSLDELRRAQRPVCQQPGTNALFWTLKGPLADSIWVMEKVDDLNSPLEPYSQGQSWHPISQSPLTEPKVSSIKVVVTNLDEWEDTWYEMHIRDSEPGEIRGDGSELLWGELSDFDPNSDEEGPPHLLVCCGIKRPRKKKRISSIMVKPATLPYITVHDYVSTVHPWLISLRDDLLKTLEVSYDQPLSLEETTMIITCFLDTLTIDDQDNVFGNKRKSLAKRLFG